MPVDFCRWPGDPSGRSHEIGERLGSALGGCRACSTNRVTSVRTSTRSGWQQESYQDNDFHNLPLVPVNKPDGSPRTISVQFPGRDVVARVWRVDVGRVPLYLLDTNIPENPRPEDRDITDQLYGGDSEMRLKQEILLGIGGFRALEAMGIHPGVYHMNEGHSAFLSLEHTRRLMEDEQLTFGEARQLSACGTVFTGHTPVIAGHDAFPADLMDRYLSNYMPGLGISRADFLGLGRVNPADQSEQFSMDGVGAPHVLLPKWRQQTARPGEPPDVAGAVAGRSGR